MFLEKVKYWIWKNWYLANFPYKSPTRFIGELRILAVYTPAFREGGMKKVKQVHTKHLENLGKYNKATEADK